MNPDLQRIEATLHQLKGPAAAPGQPASSGNRAYSFTVGSKPQSGAPSQAAIAVQPFPADHDKTPSLPRLKVPNFTSHRHAANPALALNLLKEIEGTASGWYTALNQVVQQIQELYLEGPIVDGWLESHPRKPEAGSEETAGVQPAEVDSLMSYVAELCDMPQTNVTCESPQPGYQLCGLDGDGKVWSKPCPPEQVASVGLAIARHQRLRQLLARKRQLEARLGRLAKTLIVLHSHIQEH
ncbi:hypothetical protein H6F90_03180 [Trichocoleus sp. FACHB-591]|uniref:hypothetical protein n=1 Tax=Trichocoleus sp. FACHB-591 TaxID=2692872 RepID=UPI001685C3F2|nr:hypothetical protein [Trichocoleus sp. FACHB-591]MBD2094154.1 hypothetical protein [Trichocoleus sp. FACHB-591]